MNEQENSDEIEKLVNKSALELGEWVDSVQIITTWRINGVSNIYCFGHGCLYSRLGATREWLTRMDEVARIYQRRME